MPRLIDEAGNKYDRLTVLERSDSYKYSYGGSAAQWLCECACGNRVIVVGKNLRSGNTRSCGCLHKESASLVGKANALSKGESMFNSLFYNYRRRAKEKSLEWKLTKEQFKNLTQQSCVYCEVLPHRRLEKDDCSSPYIYNGVDRLDNSRGYTLENSVPCCYSCNVIKGNISIDMVLKIHNLVTGGYSRISQE